MSQPKPKPHETPVAASPPPPPPPPPQVLQLGLKFLGVPVANTVSGADRK